MFPLTFCFIHDRHLKASGPSRSYDAIACALVQDIHAANADALLTIIGEVTTEVMEAEGSVDIGDDS